MDSEQLRNYFPNIGLTELEALTWNDLLENSSLGHRGIITDLRRLSDHWSGIMRRQLGHPQNRSLDSVSPHLSYAEYALQVSVRILQTRLNQVPLPPGPGAVPFDLSQAIEVLMVESRALGHRLTCACPSIDQLESFFFRVSKAIEGAADLLDRSCHQTASEPYADYFWQLFHPHDCDVDCLATAG